MNIPITYEYKGKKISGFLYEVSGSGSEIGKAWHLMINKYYSGQLLFTERGFLFHSQKGKFEELSEMFGDYLMLWYG